MGQTVRCVFKSTSSDGDDRIGLGGARGTRRLAYPPVEVCFVIEYAPAFYE